MGTVEQEREILNLLETKQIPLEPSKSAFLVSSRWVNLWKRSIQGIHIEGRTYTKGMNLTHQFFGQI